MGILSTNARTVLYADDIRSNSTTPRRVVLARMFKEAGLRSPRTQLTNVQIEINVRGRCTDATIRPIERHPYVELKVTWHGFGVVRFL